MLKVEPKQLDTLLHPQFDAAALKKAPVIAQGSGRLLPALPAAASYFTADDAKDWTRQEQAKRLSWFVRETSPEDIEGMEASLRAS